MKASDLNPAHINKARKSKGTTTAEPRLYKQARNYSRSTCGYVYFKLNKADLGATCYAYLTSHTLYKLLLSNEKLNYITDDLGNDICITTIPSVSCSHLNNIGNWIHASKDAVARTKAGTNQLQMQAQALKVNIAIAKKIKAKARDKVKAQAKALKAKEAKTRKVAKAKTEAIKKAKELK